jgi:hypothetical protein
MDAVYRKILVLDSEMAYTKLGNFQISKLNYWYSAVLKTRLCVTISCCLVLLCLFSLNNSMPSNVSESALASSGDVKKTSLNTVANNSSAIIDEGNMILTNNDTGIVKQETSMSEPAPVRYPGQPPHEVVFALPLRDDGKVWSGRATFTASKPIEVEVLHIYDPRENIDQVHGEPYHAVLPGNKTIAISHFRELVEIPIEINGTGMSSGTFDFTGSALVFHKTTGQPFTVTYTVDAQAKSLNH